MKRMIPARLAMTSLLLCSLAVFSSCSSGQPAIIACNDEGGVHPVCGFQNPEDLALLDDGRTLIVSQFGMMDGSRAGSIALFDTSNEELRVVFEGGTDVAAGPAAPTLWGDRDCTTSPGAAFSPHGIDLARRPDGPLQLLVANHGDREAIEMFEVVEGDQGTSLIWRGCAIPPAGSYFNDVVHLPDGGFLVTHMMEKGGELWGMLQASMGFDTGWVYEWQQDGGYRVVPGTHAPFPNGIEISADGREIYLNSYMGGQVRRISRETGELLGHAEVQQPDNLSWARDGRLLVASHTGGLRDQMACQNLEAGACAMSFEIIAIDPKTMETELIFAGGGAPMGAGTVAIDLGGELVIGSFAGDRIIRVPSSKTSL
jgi:hypothetical protein